MFSDEAHFDLGGYVNKQNCSTENPPAYIEKLTYPKRITVWCGIWSIILQFFFENEQRETVTVNGDRYRAMLNESLSQNIECSFGCVARSAVLLKPNVANILLFIFCEQKFV